MNVIRNENNIVNENKKNYKNNKGTDKKIKDALIIAKYFRYSLVKHMADEAVGGLW